MAKFRKKPVEIEAFQWMGDMNDAMGVPWIEAAAGETLTFNFIIDDPRGQVEIETLEGVMVASPEDWIIKGIKGELYPCKPDIFEATYEPVE